MADARAAAVEDQVRAILAAAGASGSWDWDIVHDQLHVDARFADLYGIDDAAASGALATKTFFSAIHPEDRARMRIAVAGMVAGAERFSKEFRVVTRSGAVLWMHGRGQTHYDDDDRPVRFTGLLVDVTERKRTEEHLRIAQSAGGVGTFEYLDGFATAKVSTEFCRLLGLHPTQVLPVPTINGVLQPGQPDLIPESPHALEIDALAAEFSIVRNDDRQIRWIARRGEIMRDGDADRTGYRLIGVIYDITASKQLESRLRELNETLEARIEQAVAERREAEEALRQAQKMEAVGQLTGGIAHDFNNLLTIIIGNIDTVIRRFEPDADPRMRRALGNALKGAERAAALTQRLLAFSRRQPLDPRSVDIARLIAGMADLLTRSITETIAVQIMAAADLWLVEVDPNQLENAILNLAVNARDAMPDGGALTIEARNVTVGTDHDGLVGILPGDYVAISVADSGTGMTADTIARIFDPFFTTKEVGKGTGLGLSMVYGFVKQSGGHVRVDSIVGTGTTVTLYLQRNVATQAAVAEREQMVAGTVGGSETILVVEDDDDVRAYTVAILRELGYRVIEAHDGPTALALIGRGERKVDLLLTDVVMPNMSGRELADAAIRIHPELRILYTSGYTRDAITRDGRLEPGVDLLGKPFTFETVAIRVRDLLDRHIG